MIKTINEWVDRILTLKTLKVILFILFVILIFVVLMSICSTDTNIAPYMIALSALFASTIAMINLRKVYIDKVLDKKEQILETTNHAIVNIDVLLNKYIEYTKMLEGEKPMSKILFNQYKILFENILSLITHPKISKYINAKNSHLFYDIHDKLFLILAYHEEIVKLIDDNPESNHTENNFSPIFTSKAIEDDLKALRIEVMQMENKIKEEYIKLYHEENF